MITLSLLALAVLPYQHEILEQRSAEQAHDEISEHDAMAGIELGCVTTAVDVRGDDAVEVSPADNDS